MLFKSDSLQKVKMVMFSAQKLPESTMKEVDGKKSFVKTGNMVEFTKYVFRDEMGQTYEILTKENGYRNLEGKYVDVTLDIQVSEFDGKTKIKLGGIAEAQSLV